jgi:hypothetical protein
MVASTTDVSVASNALVMIGSSPISSFSDSDTGAIVAGNVFDDVAEDLLASYPWTFAKKQGLALSRLVAAPESTYSAAYQLTSDVLNLRTVLVNDGPINYEVFGDQVYCDAGVSDTVIPIYTYYAPVNTWSPSFRMFCQLTLAAIFASSVAMKADISVAYQNQAEIAGRKARNMDAQSETSSRLRVSRFTSNRR